MGWTLFLRFRLIVYEHCKQLKLCTLLDCLVHLEVAVQGIYQIVGEKYSAAGDSSDPLSLVLPPDRLQT